MKDLTVRFALEHQEVHDFSRWAAAQAIGTKLGVCPHTSLGWMKKNEACAKAGQGSVIVYGAENARLGAENLELCRVIELLKEVSLDPPP